MNKDTECSAPNNASVPSGQVCAVIVTYFPDAALLRKLLNSIATQVDGVVMVDNTPQDRSIEPGPLLVASGLSMHYTIAFGENRGIAAAQNAGIAWAMAHGFTYALLFDQDSIAVSNMILQLTQVAANRIAQGDKLAAIGPRYVDPRSGRSSSALCIGKITTHQIPCGSLLPGQIIQSDLLISSGSLLLLQALEEIGTLDESLFIDHVDHDWCLRARHHGYSLYVVCGAVLEHRLGSDRVRYWFGRWRSFPAHSATRNYYMLRNILLVTRRPYVPLAWVVGELASLLPVLLASLILQSDRVSRLTLIFRSIHDGLRNRSGPLRV